MGGFEESQSFFTSPINRALKLRQKRRMNLARFSNRIKKKEGNATKALIIHIIHDVRRPRSTSPSFFTNKRICFIKKFSPSLSLTSQKAKILNDHDDKIMCAGANVRSEFCFSINFAIRVAFRPLIT
jgi:hypothetical protein